MEITTILLLIGIYIATIFISRFMNKTSYKISKGTAQPTPHTWFIPLANILIELVFLIIVFSDAWESKSNWFNGKNW